MQKFYWFIGIFVFSILSAQPLQLQIAAESAILINADTGVILYEKNAHQKHFPASITKIATAAYTLHKKQHHLMELVKADQESVASIATETKRKRNYRDPSYLIEQNSSHVGVKKDEIFTLKDLLYMMLVASANDAANVIAQSVGGDIPTFMKDLNSYLKNLGCLNTHFMNPHGLHHPEHQTTAYDMAILTKEAMQNPLFREMVSTVKFMRPKTNKQSSVPLIQTNLLLREGKYHYSKAIGVKTGYTTDAKGTFVGAAKYGERTLIAVLLKSKEKGVIFQDVQTLFETAFNQPKIQKKLLAKGPQTFTREINGTSDSLKTYLSEDLVIEFYPAEERELKCLLYWEDLTPPILKDQKVAEIVLQTLSGEMIKKLPLLAEQEVQQSWWNRVKNYF